MSTLAPQASRSDRAGRPGPGRAGRRDPRRPLTGPRALGQHWLGILAGTLFWCLLRGSVAPLDLVGGLLAASLVFLLFPMPPTSRELALRPVALVRLGARFLVDVIVSSIQVSIQALTPGPPPRSSIVAVQLASRSDLFLTLTAMLCTLIPGSVVVEAQRSTGTLFLHAFAAHSEEAVQEVREQTLAQERRLLRALARRSVLEEAGLS